MSRPLERTEKKILPLSIHGHYQLDYSWLFRRRQRQLIRSSLNLPDPLTADGWPGNTYSQGIRKIVGDRIKTTYYYRQLNRPLDSLS